MTTRFVCYFHRLYKVHKSKMYTYFYKHRNMTQDISKDLLQKSIKETIVYRNPANFCHAKDTFYVESFNNTLLIFMDKRIPFGDEEYFARSQLGVLHWNENVDRTHTSVYVRHGRRKNKKNLTRATHQYHMNLWESFVFRHMKNVFGE